MKKKQATGYPNAYRVTWAKGQADKVLSIAKLFEQIYRESLVTELAWKDRIDYVIDNKIREESFKKISFYKLIKKYFSKKIRSFFKL